MQGSCGPQRDGAWRAWPRRGLLVLLDLLREVVLQPTLLDERELGLEPVGVLLLVLEHVLEQLGRAVVARRAAELDPAGQDRDGSLLQVQIHPELLVDRLTDLDRPEPLHVGEALQVEDPLDHPVGVLHLVDRLRAYLLPEPVIAPVLAHARMQEVLVHRAELVGEDLVQEIDDLLAALHVGAFPGDGAEPLTLTTGSRAAPRAPEPLRPRPAGDSSGTRSRSGERRGSPR